MSQGVAAERPMRLGRYELITRIGQGGMADVQLALQRGPAGFEKLVVVKLVHDTLATQKAFVDMLLDEARVAALVKHPNVVDIYDLGQADGRYFIAMEYLEGEPLLSLLRAGREGKRLDALSTGRLIADAAEGLDAAHELRSMAGERLELVHHDVSLGNIVVLYSGQVKLVDFGVAKASFQAGPASQVHGKLSYMAPEKLRGSPGDRRSDIFSLGAVMWESLTLRRLFRGQDADAIQQVLEMPIDPPSRVNGDVPADFDRIVMRALDRDPARRYGTAKQLAVDIEEILRKRAYGGKNDRIARYMQETFKEHIEARQKLVHEVASKGSASAEVLDAAFAREVASGSPHAALSGPRARVDATFGALPVAQPAAPPAWEANAETVISGPPIMDEADAESTATTTTTVAPREIRRVALDELRRRLDQLRGLLAPRRNRQIAAAGGGALLLIIIVVAHCGGHGASPRPVASVRAPIAAPADAAVAPSTGVAPPTAVTPPIDAAASVAVEAANVDAAAPRAGSAAVAAGSGTPHGEPHHTAEHRPVHRDKASADALYRQGVQAYVKGDSRHALELLQRAREDDPDYAPTWRVLGKVYERIGNTGAAKGAYLRYLSLAPRAPDASQIRATMEHL